MVQGKAIHNILRESFLFKGLPPELVLQALSRGELVSFAREQAIYTPQIYRKAIGFIVSGTATVQKGDQLLLHTLRLGDCFGAAALFNPSSAYVATITAKTDTSVLFLSDSLLLDLLQQDSRIAVNYIAFLSHRIQFLNNKIDSFAAPNTHLGLCAFLRNNMRDEEVIVGNGYSQLARQLNMGRASLYRNLEALEKEGIIQRENRRIIILQPDRLSEH